LDRDKRIINAGISEFYNKEQTLISSPVYSGQTSSILFQDELATFENAVHIFRLAIWDGIHDTEMFVSSSYGSLVSCKGNCTEIVQENYKRWNFGVL
jgi:hypothetical protein